jgi:hypothetical protein
LLDPLRRLAVRSRAESEGEAKEWEKSESRESFGSGVRRLKGVMKVLFHKRGVLTNGGVFSSQMSKGYVVVTF